jgi:DNA-directed RNA polymerase subunit alpha
MDYILPDLNLMEVKMTSGEDDNTGVFTFEPLSPGYGITIGNTLRRILLSSLEGAAIKSVRIEGVDHEYATIKGLKEDVVDLILNLKTARFKLNSDEPVRLELSVKGPKKVSVSDFKKSADVEIIEPNHYIATLEKDGKLDIEVEIEKGRGYIPVERRVDEKAPIGTILVDSIYTPVKKVKYEVSNTRVGDMTNYNKLVMEITTDGSVSPSEALCTASKIMGEHLQVIGDSCSVKTEKPKKTKTEKVAKKAKETEKK